MPPVLRQTPCRRHVLMAVWPENLVARTLCSAASPSVAALLLLASCAAVPGYMPPPLEGKHENKFGKALESGDVGAEGRYEMSATEKAMDCKRLTGSIQIGISRLKDPSGRQEPSAVASAAQEADVARVERKRHGPASRFRARAGQARGLQQRARRQGLQDGRHRGGAGQARPRARRNIRVSILLPADPIAIRFGWRDAPIPAILRAPALCQRPQGHPLRNCIGIAASRSSPAQTRPRTSSGGYACT